MAKIFNPIFLFFARFRRSYERKDRFLAFQAPLYLFGLLAVWLVLILGGFSLIMWGATRMPIGDALQETGSSMTTLGLTLNHTHTVVVISLFAAASGLVIVASLVGYLPAIYSAFNRRETLVTLLEARAGAPAWGPEILWRHQRIGILDTVRSFYSKWEEWCADVAESHSTYPFLLWFRSPDPMRSWLTGLLAVLDSAALYLSLAPDSAPSEARLCLRMGFTGLRTLADVIYVHYDDDPRPDAPIQLTYEEYMRGVSRLQEIGFPMERTPEEAWADFRGWRVNYEAVALEIANRINATPGPWAGERTGLRVKTIPTKRPVDRTPDEPEGTDFTRPGTYEES